MHDLGYYWEKFLQYSGPLGIPLIVLGFVLLFATTFLDGGHEDLLAALFIILGGLFYRLDKMPKGPSQQEAAL